MTYSPRHWLPPMSGFWSKGQTALRSFVNSAFGQQTTRHLVGNADDLKDGQMKEATFTVADRPFKVLLSRIQGQYYATSHLCSHYKARLVTGTLTSEGRLTCPWHAACFNVKTGDIEEAPAIPTLQKYNVIIEDDKIYILAELAELENPTKAACDHLKVSDSGAEHFVIIGGGAAGALAAESIRQAGFSGKVTVVSKEPYLPIDRIKLSKFLTSQADSIRLYQPDYLEKIKVNYMLGRTASQLNKNNNEITLDDGETIKYDKLLIATGGEPRRLPIPGSNLKNVFVLRALEDTQGIARAMEKVDGRPRVVIIGASFIGIEAAAMLSKSAASVTVVAIETVPLERVLGTEVGKVIMRLAQKNKVDFRLESSTKAFLSKDDDSESVGKVVLLDETSLEADIVVMGVGVRPATDFVKDTLPIEADGSLKVDSKLKVIGTANIFAAGDVASYPHYSTAESIRVEHWDVAQQQGRIAGHNMVVPDASNTDYKSVPFFFTLLWGKSVRYAGYAGLYDEVIIKGDVEGDTPTFAAYYAKGGKVLAVATMGMDPLAVHFSELLRVGMTLTSEEIRSGKVQMHFDFNNICLVSFGYRSITLKTLD